MNKMEYMKSDNRILKVIKFTIYLVIFQTPPFRNLEAPVSTLVSVELPRLQHTAHSPFRLAD